MKYVGVIERIILKRILTKKKAEAADVIQLTVESQFVCCSVNVNDITVFVQGGKFFDQLQFISSSAKSCAQRHAVTL